eukprot:6013415-Amphidinium_carterae.1
MEMVGALLNGALPWLADTVPVMMVATLVLFAVHRRAQQLQCPLIFSNAPLATVVAVLGSIIGEVQSKQKRLH